MIEQAKGVVIDHCRVDADTALGMLQRWSGQRNIKIETVAELLVAAASHPAQDDSGRPRALDQLIERFQYRSNHGRSPAADENRSAVR